MSPRPAPDSAGVAMHAAALPPAGMVAAIDSPRQPHRLSPACGQTRRHLQPEGWAGSGCSSCTTAGAADSVRYSVGSAAGGSQVAPSYSPHPPAPAQRLACSLRPGPAVGRDSRPRRPFWPPTACRAPRWARQGPPSRSRHCPSPSRMDRTRCRSLGTLKQPAPAGPPPALPAFSAGICTQRGCCASWCFHHMLCPKVNSKIFS